MWLLLIEVVLVLALLAGAVWWTMFSGRPGGEAGKSADDARDEPPR